MAPKRRRASKQALRAAAWTAGAASFLASAGVIGLTPKPSADASVSAKPQVIVVKRTVKRIVWEVTARSSKAQPKVRYVTAGGSSSSTAAAPSAPVATTSGSHA
jgi:hypothetical protein